MQLGKRRYCKNLVIKLSQGNGRIHFWKKRKPLRKGLVPSAHIFLKGGTQGVIVDMSRYLLGKNYKRGGLMKKMDMPFAQVFRNEVSVFMKYFWTFSGIIQQIKHHGD